MHTLAKKCCFSWLFGSHPPDYVWLWGPKSANQMAKFKQLYVNICKQMLTGYMPVNMRWRTRHRSTGSRKHRRKDNMQFLVWPVQRTFARQLEIYKKNCRIFYRTIRKIYCQEYNTPIPMHFNGKWHITCIMCMGALQISQLTYTIHMQIVLSFLCHLCIGRAYTTPCQTEYCYSGFIHCPGY